MSERDMSNVIKEMRTNERPLIKTIRTGRSMWPMLAIVSGIGFLMFIYKEVFM